MNRIKRLFIFGVCFIFLVGNIAIASTPVEVHSFYTAVLDDKAVKHEFVHDINQKATAKKSRELCYSFIGSKWKNLPVQYTINPDNPQFLSDDFVISTLVKSAETWDKAIGKEIFDDHFIIDRTAVPNVKDGKNTLGFILYPSASIIAGASVWTTPDGEILEADVLFNTAFGWGDATLNPGKMDVQNIATHELGHVLGLGDIYSRACSSVTMYAPSSYGQTQKRTLEKADITGLKKLYRKSTLS